MKINLKTAIDFVIEQNQLTRFFPSKVSNEAESLKIEIDKLDGRIFQNYLLLPLMA